MMNLRYLLVAGFVLISAQESRAQCTPVRNFLHHACCHCKECEVHVHYCRPPCQPGQPSASQAATAAPAPAPSQAAQLMYAPIMPSTIGFTMPMMPMMPAMMPYAMQSAVVQQPSQAAQSQADCGACEPRVRRLEDGVRNLSDRMDKIETILANQTEALVGIRDALQQKDPAAN